MRALEGPRGHWDETHCLHYPTPLHAQTALWRTSWPIRVGQRGISNAHRLSALLQVNSARLNQWTFLTQSIKHWPFPVRFLCAAATGIAADCPFQPDTAMPEVFLLVLEISTEDTSVARGKSEQVCLAGKKACCEFPKTPPRLFLVCSRGY